MTTQKKLISEMRTALATGGIAVDKMDDKAVVCEFNEKFGSLENAFIGITADGNEIKRGLDRVIWFNQEGKDIVEILGVDRKRGDDLVLKLQESEKTSDTTPKTMEAAMDYCNNWQEYLYIVYLIAARQGSMIASRHSGGFLKFLEDIVKDK